MECIKIPEFVVNNQNIYTNNSQKQCPFRLFLVAKMDIFPGQEIFHPYGLDYWKSSDIYYQFPKLTTEQVESIHKIQNEYRKKKFGLIK